MIFCMRKDFSRPLVLGHRENMRILTVAVVVKTFTPSGDESFNSKPAAVRQGRVRRCGEELFEDEAPELKTCGVSKGAIFRRENVWAARRRFIFWGCGVVEAPVLVGFVGFGWFIGLKPRRCVCGVFEGLTNLLN